MLSNIQPTLSAHSRFIITIKRYLDLKEIIVPFTCLEISGESFIPGWSLEVPKAMIKLKQLPDISPWQEKHILYLEMKTHLQGKDKLSKTIPSIIKAWKSWLF